MESQPHNISVPKEIHTEGGLSNVENTKLPEHSVAWLRNAVVAREEAKLPNDIADACGLLDIAAMRAEVKVTIH